MNVETRTHMSIVRWWAYACHGFKLDERTLLHFANGGRRGKLEACLLKGMAVRPGAPDLVLLAPVAGKAGLALEVKSPDGRVSPAQKEMLALFSTQGWATAVAYSLDEAIGAITRYLKCGDPAKIT